MDVKDVIGYVLIGFLILTLLMFPIDLIMFIWGVSSSICLKILITCGICLVTEWFVAYVLSEC